MNFSVIISVYNKDDKRFLGSAVESILNQTAKPTEIIFTQDGGINKSLKDVIDRYLDNPNINTSHIVAPTNVGRGALLQLAISKAAFPLVAIMDADDVSLPDRFEQQLSVFSARPEIDVVGGWIYETEIDSDEPYALKKVPESHADIMRYARWRNPINQMTVMFKKQAVLEAGNYQPLRFFEDYWMWCRLLHKGAIFHNIQQPLVNVRAGEQMFLRRKGFRYALHELAFYRKIHQLNFINSAEFLFGLLVRLPSRFLPKFLLKMLYKSRFLRSEFKQDTQYESSLKQSKAK